ncbi:DUF6978 family protein [Staphylococcus microti]
MNEIKKIGGQVMKDLDLNSLEEIHVKALINELKYLENFINERKLQESVVSRINERQDVVSFRLGIKYFIVLKRGNIEKDRFSISLIFKDTHHVLVRIDVNGGIHKNPDGTTAPKSHIHIYSNTHEKKDRYVYKISPKDFPELYNLYSAYHSFLAYNNIQSIK